MSNKNPQKIFLPQCDGRALDFIKICAAIFMIIDHVNLIWLDRTVPAMFLIGRGAFPLFCYAVAQAVLKARGALPRRYLVKMLLLGLAVQPFYYFAAGGGTGNVIFTLALGAFCATFNDRLKPWQLYLLYTLAAVSMLARLPLEFGLAGVMLPSALLLVQRGDKTALPFLLLLLMTINAGGLLEGLEKGISAAAWTFLMLTGFASILLPLMVVDMARALRQTGRLLPKYTLHVFYPAHLVLLKLIGLAFFK